MNSHRWLLKTVVVLLFLLYGLIVPSLSAQISFVSDDPASYRLFRPRVVAAYQSVRAFYGMDSLPAVTVFLVNRQSQWDSLTHGGLREWAGAFAIPDAGFLAVKSPLHFRMEESIDVLLRHEMSHLIVHRVTHDGDLPRWFDEGLAQMVSREYTLWDDMELARGAITGTLVPLRQISDVNDWGAYRAAMAYAESQSAVAYLLERYKSQGLHDLLRELGKDLDFEEAFKLATGESFWSFEADWFKRTKRHFNPIYLFIDEGMFWGMITALFLLVYLAIRLRNRRKLKQWQEEEDALYS